MFMRNHADVKKKKQTTRGHSELIVIVGQIKQGGWAERLVQARMALKAVLILVSSSNAITTCKNYYIFLTSQHPEM